jgi:hypothetical protein
MITIKSGFQKSRENEKNQFKYLCAIEEIDGSLPDLDDRGRVEFESDLPNHRHSSRMSVSQPDFCARTNPHYDYIANINENNYGSEDEHNECGEEREGGNNYEPDISTTLPIYAPHDMRTYDRSVVGEAELKLDNPLFQMSGTRECVSHVSRKPKKRERGKPRGSSSLGTLGPFGSSGGSRCRFNSFTADTILRPKIMKRSRLSFNKRNKSALVEMVFDLIKNAGIVDTIGRWTGLRLLRETSRSRYLIGT